MLNSLRNFSKTKLAGVLVAIIVVPFVFWGMGSVFSGGNTNNVVKINNNNISTQEFIDFVNTSNISPEDLRKNLDDKLLQEILSQLVSINLLSSEVKSSGVIMSDKSLLNKLTNEKRFKDENNKFSRLKYEKFLLENNISAPEFEKKVRDSEMQKDLFQYISGGIKSPDFLVKNFYLEDTKEIELEYLSLEKYYKKEFSDSEIFDYIKENKKDLENDIISFSYTKITPKDVINEEVYNSDFFKIIDQIENDIINGENLKMISNKYQLNLKNKKNYFKSDKSDIILKQIYDLRNDGNVQLVDNDDYYLLFEIEKIRKVIPEIDNKEFYEYVINKLKSKEKFNYNKNILKKIETDKFEDIDFYKIGKEDKEYIKILIKSKDDNSFFNVDSLNLLYTIPKNDFLLIVDNNQNIYLTKIINFKFKTINDKNYEKYVRKSNFKIRNDLSQTYDRLINDKYKVVVNYNTLDRLKNFFK